MFINVFTEEDRDKLLSNGYNLISEQKLNNSSVYTFEKSTRLNFDLSQVKHIETTRINF